jgi:hypothetical protein
MSKQTIAAAVIIVLGIIGITYYGTSKGQNLLQDQTATVQEREQAVDQTATQVQAEINAIDSINMDAEFKQIDSDINGL